MVDGRPIAVNHIGYAKNAQFALTSLIYSVLTPGVVYDLQRRTVVDPGPAGPERSIVPSRRRPSTKAVPRS